MSDNRTIEERFWSKVNKTNTCWLWAASRRGNGRYGQFGIMYKQHLAHRVAYELTYGPIPDGLQIDHLCRTTLCVRPDHLEAVTARENVMRSGGVAARLAAATHCVHGHELDEANTRLVRTKNGRMTRDCRRCNSRNHIAWHRRSRAKAHIERGPGRPYCGRVGVLRLVSFEDSTCDKCRAGYVGKMAGRDLSAAQPPRSRWTN